jgi:hypothetical protein
MYRDSIIEGALNWFLSPILNLINLVKKRVLKVNETKDRDRALSNLDIVYLLDLLSNQTQMRSLHPYLKGKVKLNIFP